jgi:primosomal protein N'
VIVGTERDLAGAAQVDLALMIDADAWLLAPHYRAEEDALRIIGRLAGLVAGGSGRRCMVQTAIADHRVLAAARNGHPSPLLHELVAEREQLGFPPSGELLSIELHGAHPDADDRLRALVADDATVLGPAVTGDATRWLLQGRDLRPVRVRLRGLVQQWRDADTRVRIDADPV